MNPIRLSDVESIRNLTQQLMRTHAELNSIPTLRELKTNDAAAEIAFRVGGAKSEHFILGAPAHFGLDMIEYFKRRSYDATLAKLLDMGVTFSDLPDFGPLPKWPSPAGPAPIAVAEGSLADRMLSAARTHAENAEEPDHEVGDLQQMLMAALRMMSPHQQALLEQSAEVQAVFETGGV